jgi:hypothetical protein
MIPPGSTMNVARIAQPSVGWGLMPRAPHQVRCVLIGQQSGTQVLQVRVALPPGDGGTYSLSGAHAQHLRVAVLEVAVCACRRRRSPSDRRR